MTTAETYLAWSVIGSLGLAATLYSAASWRARHASPAQTEVTASIQRLAKALEEAPAGEPALAVILDEIRALLRARRAELTSVTVRGRLRTTTLGAEGELVTTTKPPGATGAEDLAPSLRRPTLLPDRVTAPLGRYGAMSTISVSGRSVGDRPFGEEDLALLECMAAYAAIALENHRISSQLHQEIAEREYRANRDPLTGLANRASFCERVDSAIAAARHGVVAVLLIDLDRFKDVNDTLGHHNGDVILREAAGRLTRGALGAEAVARLGGDEFAVLLADVADLDAAVRMAEGLTAAMREPFTLEGLSFEVGASVGLSAHPGHGDDAITLLQRAEVAMSAAKAGQGAPNVYTAEQDHYTPRRLALVGELRQSIEESGLAVHYQPIAVLATGEVVAAEALLRWPHPHHGFMPPDEFIPIAEQAGLMGELTDLVLNTAVAQAAAWKQSGPGLSVSVNLSARNLLEPDLVDRVGGALETSGLRPSDLTLEITESGIMSNLENAAERLGELSSMGVALAVDDFGTGHSSLSYLQQLPVDELKIDKSFIVHMGSQPNDALIVRSTVDLAHNLGLRVLAEGVEDRRTWDMLGSIGADLAQGYLLSRPLPAARFEEWVADTRADASSAPAAISVASGPSRDRRTWAS